MCKNQNAIRVYKNSFSGKESQLYKDNRYKMWYMWLTICTMLFAQDTVTISGSLVQVLRITTSETEVKV
jgi:hypothetical protein